MTGVDNVLDELRAKCINGLSNGAQADLEAQGALDRSTRRPDGQEVVPGAYWLQIRRDNQPKRWRDDVGGDMRQQRPGEAAS